MFVESKGKAENLYNAVAAPPLLLHMNKLILSIEHCFLHLSYRPMEGAFLHHAIKEL